MSHAFMAGNTLGVIFLFGWMCSSLYSFSFQFIFELASSEWTFSSWKRYYATYCGQKTMNTSFTVLFPFIKRLKLPHRGSLCPKYKPQSGTKLFDFQEVSLFLFVGYSLTEDWTDQGISLYRCLQPDFSHIFHCLFITECTLPNLRRIDSQINLSANRLTQIKANLWHTVECLYLLLVREKYPQ